MPHLEIFRASVKPDPSRFISPAVAHDLNNIITVVQGYADCLIIKHRDDESIKPQLKSISDAAKRAAIIVNAAMTTEPVRLQPQSPPPQPVPIAA